MRDGLELYQKKEICPDGTLVDTCTLTSTGQINLISHSRIPATFKPHLKDPPSNENEPDITPVDSHLARRHQQTVGIAEVVAPNKYWRLKLLRQDSSELRVQ